MRRRQTRAGAALLLALVAACLAAALAGLDPRALDLERVLEPPTLGHPMGTDALGRDLTARVLHGGRASLATGATATALALVAGSLLGALAGASRGWADVALARAADVVNAFPALIGALAILGLAAGPLALLPAPARVGLVVGAFSWPGLFRYLRAETRAWAASDVRASARAAGASTLRTVVRHLLPLSLAPALTVAPFLAAGAILAEAGLGFLGLGISPPDPSWGNLLADARAADRSAWWLPVFPGTFLFAAVLGCYLLGEGLRSAVERS
ncbi:MAG: ABC transporter permease [Acidobacteria bacterium]|nr:ABC transporter permease [Acidobacteriota bacterium]